MNWLEKIRDNFIPIEKLYNKNFYTDKVAALLLELPLSSAQGETSLVMYTSKGKTKHEILKQYRKQAKIIARITKQMDKFRIYDPNSRQYIQTVRIQYGQGLEYLILGEILERKYGFKFPFRPEDIQYDRGKELCENIELALNRLPAYFKDKKYSTLKNIQTLIKQRIHTWRLQRAEDEQ